MRILYITNAISGAGGLERVLAIKTNYLVQHYGYEIHIMVLNDDEKPFYVFNPGIKIHNVEVLGNPFLYFKKYITGLKEIANKIQPDIISVCDDGFKGFTIPLFVRNCKIIYERHASINIENKADVKIIDKFKSKFKHFLMNRLAQNFDKFIVLTNGNVSEWKLRNALVIPNPLPFYSELSSSLDSERIICVGSHSFNKGYDLLLKAWKNIVEKHPNWRLNVYGKFDQDETFLKLAKEYGLNPKEIFFEPVQNIQQEYLDSSIMVLPSRSEGFGMVLIEAMACGVPCVSFDCPSGPKDVIENNVDGFLVPQENVEMLSKKIIELIENVNLRKKMGMNAKQNVKRFLPEKIVYIWNDLFKEIVK